MELQSRFVPYKLSIHLKKIGFDDICTRYYSPKKGGTLFLPERMEVMHNIQNSTITSVGYCSAPTWQEAFDWFREKHLLDGVVYPIVDLIKTSHGIKTKYTYSIFGLDEKVGIFNNFKSALRGDHLNIRESCLRQLIKIVELGK